METAGTNVVPLPEEPRRIRRRMLLATAARQRLEATAPPRGRAWINGRPALVPLRLLVERQAELVCAELVEAPRGSAPSTWPAFTRSFVLARSIVRHAMPASPASWRTCLTGTGPSSSSAARNSSASVRAGASSSRPERSWAPVC